MSHANGPPSRRRRFGASAVASAEAEAGPEAHASERVGESEGRSPSEEKKVGGEGGIRTPVRITPQDAFEAPPLRPLRYLSKFNFARWSLFTFSTSLRARSRRFATTTLRRSLAAASACLALAIHAVHLSSVRSLALRCSLHSVRTFGAQSLPLAYAHCVASHVVRTQRSRNCLLYYDSARFVWRRPAKNRCITSRQSSSSTRPRTSSRWLSDGCSWAFIADSIAPAFGSGAP